MKSCQICGKEIPDNLKKCIDCERVSSTGMTAETLKSFAFFWVIDPAELRKQVSEYDTLTISQSARGVSLLCLLVSAAITAGAMLFHAVGHYALLDVAVMLTIGFCIYRGQRWASIAAIILWTLERLFGMAALPRGEASTGPAIFGFFWWAAFIRPFWCSFKVEQERRHPSINANELTNLE